MKKLNWLDKFAQEQAAKLQKTAGTVKKAEQVIVNPEDVPGAQEGATVQYNGEDFTVVNANYSDDIGAGVVLEKAAAYEGLEQDPMGLSMGAPASAVAPGTGTQEYARTDANTTQQTYTNDEDAAWGSSSAPATEQQIAGENATDRTTIPGKFTPSPELNSAAPAAPVAPMATEEAPVVEEVPAEAPVAEEAPVEEVAVEETAPAAEEVPAEEKEEKVASRANRILARMQAKN